MIVLGSAAGVFVLALVHVIATGDIAGILTFGSVAVLELAGTRASMRGRPQYPIEWARFPYGEIGRWRLVLAVVLIGAALAGVGGPSVQSGC